MSWRTGLMLLLAAGGLCGCGTPGPSANSAQGSQVRAGSSCDTAVAAAPVLSAVSQAAVPVPGSPFSVVATADGRWSFVTLGSAVEVLSNRFPGPRRGPSGERAGNSAGRAADQ